MFHSQAKIMKKCFPFQ